jgi:hypothetical protein
MLSDKKQYFHDDLEMEKVKNARLTKQLIGHSAFGGGAQLTMRPRLE